MTINQNIKKKKKDGRVQSTNQSAAPVLQQQSQEETGLGEDAAALFGHFVSGLLSVALQQIQQDLHRVLHRVHGLDGLVVLERRKQKRGNVELLILGGAI